MAKTPTFTSLIQNLDPDQILTIIHEKVSVGDRNFYIALNKKNDSSLEKLLHLDISQFNNPVHYLYVVDPYDILYFCFPFGYSYQDKVEGSELDQRWVKQTAWDNFFSTTNQFLLMEEHRTELGRNRKWLLSEMKVKIDGFDEFEKLVKKVYGFDKNNSVSKEEVIKLKDEIFQKRLPWLVAAGTGELHKAHERFLNILKKLIFNYDHISEKLVAPWLSDDEKQIHVDVIMDLFRETTPGKEVLKQYFERLDMLESKNVEVGESRKNSLLVDYNVVDMLIKINQRLSDLESELGCRYIVLYLSSDNKSKFISREIDERCPPLFGKPFNIMRNVSQLWIDFLLMDDESGFDNRENRLESLETVIQNAIIIYDAIAKKQNLTESKIVHRIEDLKERVEWYGLIKNMTAYPEKLKKVFEELQNRATFEPLKLALEEVVETLKTTNGKQGLEYFSQEIRNFNMEVTVLEKIVSVLDSNPSPDISSLGYVVGINHHLPTLFEKTQPVSKYEKLIDNTVELILSPGKVTDYGKDLRSLAKDLKNLVLTDDIPDIQLLNEDEDTEKEIQHYERQTLLHLFALLLPARNLKSQSTLLSKHMNSEEYSSGQWGNKKQYNLDNELDELLSYDIRLVTGKIKKSVNDLERNRKFLIILENLRYIRIWSLRRNDRFDKCAEILREAQEFNSKNHIPDDARIFHGLALNSYSILLQLMESKHLDSSSFIDTDEVTKKYWKQAQRDVEKAISIYETVKNTKFDKLPYQKAYSALLNTQIYVYVIGYAMTKDYNRLSLARKILDNKMKGFEDDRRLNPECLHTEANLEMFEAIYFYDIDKKKSKEKITYAFKAIKSCKILSASLFPNKAEDSDYLQLADKIMSYANTKLDCSFSLDT